MLKNIRIQNYRGIKDLQLDDFKKINLLVGKNNCGKSTILEAIFSFLYANNVQLLYLLSNGDTTNTSITAQSKKFWERVELWFNNLQTSEPIKISSKADNKKLCELEITYSEEAISFSQGSPLSTSPKNLLFRYKGLHKIIETGINNALSGNIKRDPNPITDFANGMSEFVNPGSKKSEEIHEKFANFCKAHEENQNLILQLLQKIEPRLRKIIPDEEISCFIKEDVSIPINSMGDGMRIFLNIITTMYQCKNAIAMFDEIDSGLHWTSQKTMWEALIEASNKSNVQIFATTHSYEMISSLIEVYDKIGKNILGEDQMRLFSIDIEDDQKLRAIKYDAEMIRYAVDQNKEMR